MGGFTEGLPYWQDYEFHMRTLIQNPAYEKYLHLPPDCYNRRHSKESISQQGFQREDKLLTRIAIYQNIVQQVEQRGLLDNDARTAAIVFLFNQARKLVIDHQNLSSALDTWTYASEKGKLAKRYRKAGSLHFQNLYRHQLSGRKMSVYLFLAKFATLMLPKKYKHIKSTLCKLPLEYA